MISFIVRAAIVCLSPNIFADRKLLGYLLIRGTYYRLCRRTKARSDITNSESTTQEEGAGHLQGGGSCFGWVRLSRGLRGRARRWPGAGLRWSARRQPGCAFGLGGS